MLRVFKVGKVLFEKKWECNGEEGKSLFLNISVESWYKGSVV